MRIIIDNYNNLFLLFILDNKMLFSIPHVVISMSDISMSDIVAITELRAITFFTNSSSIENCLEIR